MRDISIFGDTVITIMSSETLKNENYMLLNTRNGLHRTEFWF